MLDVKKKIYNSKEFVNYFTYIYFKRFCDFFLAVFGLIFLSPLFLLIAIIIKATDGGSVFYLNSANSFL